MYYCTIPNIFNRVNNDLLDLSGNMNIDGDIKINSGGRLISLDSTFDLLNTNVTTLNMGGSATNINIGNTDTGGFTNIQNQLSVAGNTTFQNNLNVDGNLQADNWLIRGTLDLSLSRHFFLVAQDASMQSNLYVEGLTIMQDGSFNRSMSVGTDSSFNGNVYVGGNTVLNKNIDVLGNTKLNNNLNIIGDLSANRNVNIRGNTQLYSKLDVSDNVIMRNGLSVANDTSMGGNLIVMGNTIVKGTFIQQGSTTFTGGLSILTPALIGSSIDVSDNAVIRSNLNVLGDISLNRRLFVGNVAVINKPPTSAKVNAILDVSGAIMTTTLGIATQSVNSQYSLDISGHTNSTGCIFQF
jgi:acyl-[acyl carrier protein]--UDP-N-acetylglucosamine O-acyltransferase